MSILHPFLSIEPMIFLSLRIWGGGGDFKSFGFKLLSSTNKQQLYGLRCLNANLVNVGLGSSISTWVRNCEKLTLGEEEREQLDSFIDQLYADLDTGELFDQGNRLGCIRSIFKVPKCELRLILQEQQHI